PTGTATKTSSRLRDRVTSRVGTAASMWAVPRTQPHRRIPYGKLGGPMEYRAGNPTAFFLDHQSGKGTAIMKNQHHESVVASRDRAKVATQEANTASVSHAPTRD